jgi:hypothetical protein
MDLGEIGWVGMGWIDLAQDRDQCWAVVERGPPSLVSTIEELLGRKSSGSGLESRGYGRRDPSR